MNYLIVVYCIYPIISLIGQILHNKMSSGKFFPLWIVLKIEFTDFHTYLQWLLAPIFILFKIAFIFWYLYLIKNNKSYSIEDFLKNAKNFIDEMGSNLKK